MSSKKFYKYYKVATNITYHKEDSLRWYWKLFFHPPSDVEVGYFNTKKQAEHAKLPPYRFMGKDFHVSEYDCIIQRIRR